MDDIVIVKQGRIPSREPCKSCGNGLLSNCELKPKGKVKEFFNWKIFESIDDFLDLREEPIYKCMMGFWVIANDCRSEDFMALDERVTARKRQSIESRFHGRAIAPPTERLQELYDAGKPRPSGGLCNKFLERQHAGNTRRYYF
ncbi:MAG: hypothetical protein ABII22_04620 [Candidatus Micrarchaeota archaeon]